MQTIQNLKKFIQARRLISIAGLLLYPTVLWVFRPYYYGANPVTLVILGSLPHFLAGLLLPVSALKPELMLKFPERFHQIFIAICLFVLFWLIMEEFYPIFSPSSRTDVFDIIFGATGVLTSLLLYEYYFRRVLRNQTEGTVTG